MRIIFTVFRGTAVAAVLPALLLSACSRQEGGPTADGPTVTLGSWQEPDTLNPLTYQMSTSNEVLGLCYRELTGMDDQWNFFPQLAQALPSPDAGTWVVNGDGTMRVDWTLKPGLKWQDGTPLTVEDFIFGYEMAMNDALPVASRDREEKIDRIEKTGEGAFSVYYSEPYAYADVYAPRPMPAHLLREPMAQLADDPSVLDAFGRQPLCNGPYQVKRWEPGQYVELVKNEHWHGAAPFFDRAVYRLYGENTLLPQSLKAGQIDATSANVGLTINHYLAMRNDPPEGITPYGIDGLVWEHLDFNLDDKWLSDARVRRALVLATDRERITKTLFEGVYPVAHSWLPPRHYGYDDTLPPLAYDPHRAAALLDEAGFPMGPDGVRVSPGGEPFSLIVMTTTGDNVRKNVQELMKDMWAEVGIAMEIRNQNAKTLFGETLQKRQFPHLLMYAWTMSPLADGVGLWTCDRIPTAENNYAGQNMVGLCDEELDKLEKAIPATVSKEERIALFAQEQARWRELMPTLPLYFRKVVGAHRSDLENFKPTGSEVAFTWNGEMWGLGVE